MLEEMFGADVMRVFHFFRGDGVLMADRGRSLGLMQHLHTASMGMVSHEASEEVFQFTENTYEGCGMGVSHVILAPFQFQRS